MLLLFVFFFAAPATAAIYTLSLHDALPISLSGERELCTGYAVEGASPLPCRIMIGGRTWRDLDHDSARQRDRKSTRLNSSHQIISYAVFCLKKKNTPDLHQQETNNKPTAHR